MLFHRFVLGELSTNCYIVADEITKNALLIDAPDNAEHIITYLTEKGLNLKYILLTHGHFDHMLAMNDIKDKTNADICIHKMDEKYLTDGRLNLSADFYPNCCFYLPDRALEDGDIIEMDSLSVKVLHTPGHTEGSVCYLCDNILMSGDTLFLSSVGRTDFPLGDFDSEIRSINEKLMPLADEIKVYPGHGFSTTIGKERKENPYIL